MMKEEAVPKLIHLRSVAEREFAKWCATARERERESNHEEARQLPLNSSFFFLQRTSLSLLSSWLLPWLLDAYLFGSIIVVSGSLGRLFPWNHHLSFFSACFAFSSFFFSFRRNGWKLGWLRSSVPSFSLILFVCSLLSLRTRPTRRYLLSPYAHADLSLILLPVRPLTAALPQRLDPFAFDRWASVNQVYTRRERGRKKERKKQKVK